ncbi:hypothetical protein [Desulfopila sp. IMCC35008]|uniref:hypothetical protein n=1 Tax=Desulfopila sp. IMCC35008 TaxID=2653858 RepID=UPI0013D7E73C|nr:hypothetical protein [Desulfopila sp. IMCC35008]
MAVPLPLKDAITFLNDSVSRCLSDAIPAKTSPKEELFDGELLFCFEVNLFISFFSSGRTLFSTLFFVKFEKSIASGSLHHSFHECISNY